MTEYAFGTKCDMVLSLPMKLGLVKTDERGVLRREPGQEGRAEEGAVRQVQSEGGRQDVL